MPVPASTHIWMLDAGGSTTGSPPTAAAAGYPANYYIVIDDILLSMTSGAAADVYVTVKADDTNVLMNIGKTFLAAETDTFHLPFPKGFVLPKATKSATGGGRIDVHKEGAYTSNALFTFVGSPAAGILTVSLRYLSPAEIGV